MPPGASMAAEDLRQSVEVEQLCGIKDRFGQTMQLRIEPVTLQSKAGDRVARGPYRAEMVGKWIVCRMAIGQCSNAPAAEHLGAHQPRGDGFCLVVVDDAIG